MSLMHHELWPQIAPYIRVQAYDRDGGHQHPRIRIELDDMPHALALEALRAMMPCVACARLIHPIRQRRDPSPERTKQAKGLYYAPTCPLGVSVGCSRGAAARDEYTRFRGAIKPRQLPKQLTFDV